MARTDREMDAVMAALLDDDFVQRAGYRQLYDNIAAQTSAAKVAIGHFPEFDLQAPAPRPTSDSPIRIALATVMGGSSAPPGYKSVRVIDIDDCWLQVARMKSNSSGPLRRTFWQAAQVYVRKMEDGHQG